MEHTVQQKPKGGAMRVIRNIYLYLVTLVGLITFIIGSVGLINDVLQRYVFHVDQSQMYSAPAMYPGYSDQCSSPYADPADTQGKKLIVPTTQQVMDCRQAQTQQNQASNDSQFGRDLSIALAQILIGLPIWLFHWSIIQGENKKREEGIES